MTSVSEAEHKLNLADYLLNRDPPFPEAAVKHLLQAANILVQIYLNLDKNAKISPQIASQKLSADPEAKDFVPKYLDLWRLAALPLAPREEVANAYKATKLFLNTVKRAYGSA